MTHRSIFFLLTPLGKRVAVLVLLLCGHLTAQKVEVGFDKQTDFGSIRTYQMAMPTRPAGNPLLANVVMGTIEYELQNKGLQRVDLNPDVMVQAYGGVNTQSFLGVSDPTYSGYGGAPLPGTDIWTGSYNVISTPFVRTGSLTVDLIAARDNILIWRATTHTDLDFHNKKKLIQQINKTVEKMFQKYPAVER